MSDEPTIPGDALYDKWNRRADLFNRIGWPAIIVIAIGVVIWKVMVWSAPFAEQIAKKHVETLDVMQTTQKEIVAAQTSIAQSIERQSENGREFVAIAKAHKETTDEIAKKLNEVHKAVTKKPPEE